MAIYADVALGELRDALTRYGYIFQEGKVAADGVDMFVDIGDKQICVWFSADKQLYGFNMLQGGSKTARDIQSLMNNFEVYTSIITVLLPKAKAVACALEEELGISVVYTKFVGKRDDGYEFLFQQVGDKNKGFRVKGNYEDATMYSVLYVQYTGNSLSVISEHQYKVADGTVSKVVEQDASDIPIEDIVDGNKFCKVDGNEILYADGTNTLRFDVESACVNFFGGNSGLLVADVPVVIHLEKAVIDSLVNDILERDIWRYIPLYDEIVGSLDDNGNLVAFGKTYEVSSIGEELVVKDGNKVMRFSDYDSLSLYLESNRDAEKITVEEDKPVKKHTGITVKKVQNAGGIIGIRFVTDDGIYDMSREVASELGLPVDRVSEVVDLYERNGILISDDEVQMKRFSESVSDDLCKCKMLIGSLFE